METGFLIPSILFLLCLSIRSVYEILKEAHKVNMESKPIFTAVFISMCVLWASWLSLCPKDPLPLDLPGVVRWSGLVIFIAGTFLAVGALIQLRGVENIDHLVTGGLFSKIRHPMYIGFISWIVGWSIYHGAMVSLAIGVVGIVDILWWRHLEEGRLEVQFGTSYHQYRQSTWL